MESKKTVRMSITHLKIVQADFKDITHNVNHMQCYNHQAASANVKCLLESELVNINAVKNISFPFYSFNFSDFITKITFAFDTEYTIPASAWPSNITNQQNKEDKMVFLEASSIWQMDGNPTEDPLFSSRKVSNKHSVEAMIPPSSCFNMTMKESLAAFTLQYNALAVMKIYEDDIRLHSINLAKATNTISESFTVDAQIAKMDISGSIDINLLSTDHASVIPCN